MLTMKKLGSEFRLQADSDEGVTKPFELAILHLPSALKFQGRKLRPGPFINALVCWWSRLPKKERERIAGEALAGLEGVLRSEEEGDVSDIPPELRPGTDIGKPEELPEIRENVASFEKARKSGKSPKARRQSGSGGRGAGSASAV